MPPSLQFGAPDYVLMALGIVLSVVLLFGGITLVARRPVGRTLHLVYALGSMPLAIVNLVRQYEKQDALAQWAKDYPNNPMAQSINSGSPSQQAGEYFGLCLGLILGIGVPLFYFIWFGLVKTKPVQITGTEEGVY